MLPRCLPVLSLSAALLGCTTASVGVAGGAGGVAVGLSATTAPADPRMCMYDRARGELRTCLHFSFGQCAMFGDPCSTEPRDAAPPAAPAPPDP